jgi:hypothetical protein
MNSIHFMLWVFYCGRKGPKRGPGKVESCDLPRMLFLGM